MSTLLLPGLELEGVTVYNGDSREILPKLPENSVSAVVTDPPYDLTSIRKRFGKENSAPCQEGKDGRFKRLSKGFMGKQWDGTGIAFDPDFWREVYRVLKPGGHLLSFGGTRTYHRMVCAVEDAGFEIRDCIFVWGYSTGFPKNLNVTKKMMDIYDAIDKQGIIKVWKENSETAKHAALRFLKNGIGIGTNMQKSDSVPVPVLLSTSLKESYADAILAELNSLGVHPALEDVSYSAPLIVEECFTEFTGIVKSVENSHEGHNPQHSIAISIAPSSVKELLNERIKDRIKGVEVLKTWPGNKPLLNQEAIIALYVVLAEGLKHIILSQSKTFQNLDMKRQTEFVSVTNATITEYMAECLIIYMVDMLKENILDGLGTALKPSAEPVVVARKPLSESSVAANVLKWGTGALNIDACRITSTDGYLERCVSQTPSTQRTSWDIRDEASVFAPSPEGRWPSNFILTHTPFCEQKLTRRVKKSSLKALQTSMDLFDEEEQVNIAEVEYEEIEEWNCHPDCLVRELDRQSGERVSGYMEAGQPRKTSLGKGGYQEGMPDIATLSGTYGDEGYASRFFYVAKPSAEERNKFYEKLPGIANRVNAPRECEAAKFKALRGNHHPTVKPVMLLSYLLQLVTPPGGIILDPFVGSGTTLIAARNLGIVSIGIEKEEEYLEIIAKRLSQETLGI
jgi:DNA modification methylase